MLATLAALLLFRVPETGQAAPEGTDAAPLFHRAVIRPGLALFTGVAGTAGFLALVGAGTRPTSASRAWSVVPLVYRGDCGRLPDRVRPSSGPPATVETGRRVIGALHDWPCCLGDRAEHSRLVCWRGHSGARRSAFLTPAIFAAIFGAVPAHERGAAAGTVTVFIDLGFGGGTMLLGFVRGRRRRSPSPSRSAEP